MADAADFGESPGGGPGLPGRPRCLCRLF